MPPTCFSLTLGTRATTKAQVAPGQSVRKVNEKTKGVPGAGLEPA